MSVCVWKHGWIDGWRHASMRVDVYLGLRSWPQLHHIVSHTTHPHAHMDPSSPGIAIVPSTPTSTRSIAPSSTHDTSTSHAHAHQHHRPLSIADQIDAHIHAHEHEYPELVPTTPMIPAHAMRQGSMNGTCMLGACSCSYHPVMSRHVTSCHVTSCHVTSCHVMSCHDVCCHVLCVCACSFHVHAYVVVFLSCMCTCCVRSVPQIWTQTWVSPRKCSSPPTARDIHMGKHDRESNECSPVSYRVRQRAASQTKTWHETTHGMLVPRNPHGIASLPVLIPSHVHV